MTIRDLIVDACALVDLKPGDARQVIGQLVQAVQSAVGLADADKCLADVLARERQRTTAIGGGLAIPHALTDGVRQPLVAIGRCRDGADFRAPDELPVRLVFLLLSPPPLANLHLKVLARLANILRSGQAVEELLQAAGAPEVLAFFQQREAALGDIRPSEDMPTLCVVGAGAGGLAMTAHLALLGCRVRLYNRSQARILPVQQMGGIQATGQIHGFAKVSVVTTDPGEALENADVVMVVVPATGHREVAGRLAPHLRDGQIVILNPGRTGGALEFTTVLRQKNAPGRPIVAEAQTLLYACRDVNPGSVHVFSVKNAVPVAALPAYLTPDVLAVTSRFLPHFVAGDNVLKTSLDNIGCIFHPALMVLNAAWIEGRHGDFEYYRDGASPSVAAVLEELDKERIAVAAALGIGQTTARDWLYIAYGASGKDLYEAIQSNPGYEGIKAPNRLTHRYITEDVPMSLVPIASLGEHLGVKVPTMRAIIHLAGLLQQHNYWAEGRTVDKLGLAGMSVQQIRRLVVEGL